MSVEKHNKLAPELLRRLVKGTDSEPDAMVVLESVVLGAMLYFRPDPRHASEFLDILTERVITRMHEDAAR
jgi:hypothetical protein